MTAAEQRISNGSDRILCGVPIGAGTWFAAARSSCPADPEDPDTSSEERQEAVKELMGLTKRMEQEKELEGLILAKGYKEAAAFVQPNAVTVVVRAAQITPEDAARITDLAVRSTGRPAEQVSIIAK